MLANSLSKYIKDQHTQEECIGFIDGYASAMSQGLLSIIKQKIKNMFVNIKLI